MCRVDFLSGVCVACGTTFNKWRKDQVTCGKDGCRKGRHRRAIRAEERKQNEAQRWERRRAKSTVDLVSQTRGPNSRDSYKEATRITKDKEQKFSRCLQCGKEFVENDKPRTSSFQFCGESDGISGSCKQAWIEAHPIKFVLPEKKPVVRDFLDEERVAYTKRINAPATVRMGRLKLNFCPLCSEYVNQDHEHVEVRQVA